MQISAVAIFVATYLFIAIGKLPGYHLDRAGAALLGASLMVAIGGLSIFEAFEAIDLETITLLLGMMIVVANLRLSGIFRVLANWIVVRAHHPVVLLVLVVMTAGVLSAFLVNDTICLVLAPLVLDLLERLKRDARPYLLALAMASNAGSVATITGNPQNMIVGALSHIPYATFATSLAPIAGVGMLLTILLVAALHPREFLHGARFPTLPPEPAPYHRALALKSLAVTLAMMVLFFAGQPIAKVAILAGAILLFTRRVKAEKVYFDIDWPLLVMFVGLFIVVAGFEKAALTPGVIDHVRSLDLGRVPVLAGVAAVLSNLVSNVPAVLVLKPFVPALAEPEKAWLTVAMASTLAGNLTLVGSVANLIVVQRARARGIVISFWDYFRVGAPLTLLSLAFGVFWLSL